MFTPLTTIPWAYPALEATHIIGIALLLGNLVALEVRVFGGAAALPVPALARLSLTLALTRLDAWKVAEIRVGAQVSAIGYASSGEQGDAAMRVEYLFAGGKAYGLRSSPA